MSVAKSNLLSGLSIVIDRDGTLIKDKHYLSDPEGVELLPGVVSALRQLNQLGAKLYIVTNQSGIGRGYFSLNDYKACEARLDEILSAQGIIIEHTVFCPHAPEESCLCRKPASGMWDEIAARYSLSPDKAIMIGDKMDDVNFGLNCKFAAVILVLSGKGLAEAEKYKIPIPPALMECARTDVCSTDHQIISLTQANPAHPHAGAVNFSAETGLIIQIFR